MRTYQDINFLALFFRKDATNEIFIENILLTNISLYTVESFRRIFRKKNNFSNRKMDNPAHRLSIYFI